MSTGKSIEQMYRAICQGVLGGICVGCGVIEHETFRGLSREYEI